MDDGWEIRVVRPEEWPLVRELRLEALADPMAPVAFLETLEEARARPDAFWLERALRGSEQGRNRQFVALAPDGTWAGTVTVLVEEPGAVGYLGEPVTARTASIVGVFVRDAHRGTGLTGALFAAAVAWARGLEGVRDVLLRVHRDNPRAEAAYRKAGFVRTGVQGVEHDMAYTGFSD